MIARIISKKVCKNIYVPIMGSGNSSNDTQCIPFTPKKGQHNIRGAFSRFEVTSKGKKTT